MKIKNACIYGMCAVAAMSGVGVFRPALMAPIALVLAWISAILEAREAKMFHEVPRDEFLRADQSVKKTTFKNFGIAFVVYLMARMVG